MPTSQKAELRKQYVFPLDYRFFHNFLKHLLVDDLKTAKNMSGTSDVNLKQALRKKEFPLCAHDALNEIVQLICSRITSIKTMDLSLDLMAEFVFWEVDRRGRKRVNPLDPLDELQLLEILYTYLNSMPNETARNTLFLNLFSPTTASARLPVLSKLISLAIGIPSPVILISTSTWMQQLGCTSINSCKLAESLVYDYFHLAPNPGEKLKNLPNTAPQFTANFLTAVAENYFAAKKEPMIPPPNLLKCITEWISENPTLCTAAQQRQAVLPPGAIAMEATTPFAGLLRWCILAPVYKQEEDTYSNLYLALLNSIMEVPRNSTSKAIYAQHLTSIISPLISYFREMKQENDAKLDKILSDSIMQLALDRFGQAIQVALSVNAIYGHIDELFNNLQHLPYNKLLSIVVSRYKQSKPIVIV